MEDLIKRIEEKFFVKSVYKQRDDLYIVETDEKHLISMLLYLKEQENYKHLALISCVDWIEDNLFQLSYTLGNYKTHTNLIIKIFIDREKASFETIYHIWPQAEAYEREIHELFGVHFEGNKRENEEMILEDWEEIPPFRKEFDTYKYAEENYGFRFKRNDKPIREIISEITDEWREK